MKKKKQLNKVVALLLVFVLNFALASEVFAYYSDVESSNENTFKAGSLDFLITNPSFDGVISNTFGDSSQFETTVAIYLDGFPLEYDAKYEKTGGSDTVCDGLNIETGVRGHDEALSGFDTDTTTALGLWSFKITNTPLNLPVGEACEFDLIFEGLVEGETSGFSDEERINVTITIEEADTVVLNEFLPHPDGEQYGFDFGEDHSDMPQGEWVELYNLTSNPVDLSDWYVQDASGGVGNTQITNLNTVPATTTIPANGFLVIYMNKPVWNNTGDVVKLFDGSDTLIDSYAYSSDYDYCFLRPTPGGSNTEIPSGGDDCGNQVPGNKSYARIPDGTGAFVDPIPTPGNVNILDDESAALIQTIEETQTATVNDTEAPVITVIGNNPALIEKGAEYSDLGARVTDNVNDNLGITAEGEDIDASILGEYEVLYTATDQAGNRGSATRLVIVYDPAEGIPEIPEEEPIVEEEIVELSVSLENIPLISEIVEPEPEVVVEEETPIEEVPVVDEPVIEEVLTEEIPEVVEEITEEPIVEEETVEEPIVEEVPVEEETPIEEVVLEEEAIKEESEIVPEEEAAVEVVEEVVEEPEVVVEEETIEEETVEEITEEVIEEPTE